MKVYISGPITGQEEEAKQQFASAEQFLEDIGVEPLNPFGFNHNHEKTHQAFMRVCISRLLECHEICMLPNWKDSDGARLEKEIAESIGMNVKYL